MAKSALRLGLTLAKLRGHGILALFVKFLFS